MSDFDLRALVRDVCADSSATDPQTLAKEVGTRIDRRDLRAALDQALPTIVQHVISRARGAHTDSPGGHGGRDAQRTAAAGGRSSKVAAIRDAWQRRLRERVAVGPARTDWKFLGDCTADDLDYAASIRETLAAANAATARQFRELADAVRSSGVHSVRDLSDVAARLSESA